MNENELMDKLLSSITDYINPNKKHWVVLYEESGLQKDDEIFRLLKNFSDKNTRIGDDSKSQSFDGLNTIEIKDKIFSLYIKDEKIRNFLNSL